MFEINLNIQVVRCKACGGKMVKTHNRDYKGSGVRIYYYECSACKRKVKGTSQIQIIEI